MRLGGNYIICIVTVFPIYIKGGIIMEKISEEMELAIIEVEYLIKKTKEVDLYKSTLLNKFKLIKKMIMVGLDIVDAAHYTHGETFAILEQMFNCIMIAQNALINLFEFEIEKVDSKDEFVLGTSANNRWYKDYEEALHSLEELVVKLDPTLNA